MAAVSLPLRISYNRSVIVRPILLRQMWPLSDVEIGEPGGFAATHRQLVYIGNAVDPDGFLSQQLGYEQRKKAGCGTCCDHHMRPYLQHHSENRQGQVHYMKRVAVAGSVGHAIEASLGHQ